MNVFLLIFTILLLTLTFQGVSQNVFAAEESCVWQIPDKFKISNNNLIKSSADSNFHFSLPSHEFSLDSIDCNFFQKTNLKNQLISLQFSVYSDQNYSMIISLIDSNGQSASTKSISDWYGISPNRIANIVINSADFKPNSNKFSLNDVVKLKLELSENVESFNLSNISLHKIQNYETFSEYDNLPIQSIIPGFFLLLIISFPSGFLLVYFTRFFNNQNFFVKLPWIFCFGFFSYISFIYFIGLFQLTAETVLFYIIIEYVILAIFLIKQNLLKFKIKNYKFNLPTLFFIFLLISSGIFSVSTIGFTGWPISANDGQGHSILTSLTMYHNQVWDGLSFYPIRDVPPEFLKSWVWYPKGFHTASAGIGLLSNTFPGVALSTTFSFMVFIIPPLLASIVYRFSNSIFYSSLMFLIVFWRPGDPSMPALFGDLFWDNWLIGLLSNQVGIIAAIASFIIFIEIFQHNSNKLRLMIVLLLVFITTALSYYSFLALMILVGLFCFIPFYIHNKKRLVIALSSLVTFVALYPIWSSIITNFLSSKFTIVTENITPHWKYLTSQPFDPSGHLFPFWVSVLAALIGAGFLVRITKYRFLSIIVIVISAIHILAINEYLYLEHFSFNGNLRSLSLIFYFSIILNLLIIQKILCRLKEKNYLTFFNNKRQVLLKTSIIVLVIFLLIPSFSHFTFDVLNINRINKVPGGNEYNLLLWLYENTDRNDLVLNDHSPQSFYYTGFRAQNMTNMQFDVHMISRAFDSNTKEFKPKYESGINTVKANEILKNPWDYDYISKTLEELDIKYVYVSERKNTHQKCTRGLGNDSCYPDSAKWNWKQYSGDSRLSMYENHPNLELVIRNGNSAIFKVI